MKEMLADLDDLRPSLLFLDECPVSWSRFHACVKGQERSLMTQALVGPQGFSTPAAFGGCVLISFLLCTLMDLRIRRQAQQVEEGSLVGIAHPTRDASWPPVVC